ncbi:MAG: hypothetical protein NXI32_09735 [bacterium]|nr:hypothetical protein [bacterium]
MTCLTLRNGLSVAAAQFCALSICLLGHVRAQESASEHAGKESYSACLPEADSAEVAKWLDALASNSFVSREWATSELLRIGEPALHQLKQFSSQQIEVQRRVERIVNQLETDRFERISRQFLLDADADSESSCGLPAWRCYCKLVGASRTSKLLYLDMIRQQPDLARSIDRVFCQCQDQADGDALPALLADTAELSSRLHNDRLVRMLVPEIGDVLAVLLATSLLEGTAPVEVNEFLATSAHSVPVSTYMHRRGYGKVLRQLYALWIPKTHQSMAGEALLIAMRDGYSTGAEIARKHVDSHLDVRLRESAIQCLARFGDASDLPLMLRLLDDETVCHEFPASQLPGFWVYGIQESDESPPNVTENSPGSIEEPILQYRVCDLALASSMLISNERMHDAFPRFAANEILAFDVKSIAVLKQPEQQQERAAQIDQWKQQLASMIAAKTSAD